MHEQPEGPPTHPQCHSEAQRGIWGAGPFPRSRPNGEASPVRGEALEPCTNSRRVHQRPPNVIPKRSEESGERGPTQSPEPKANGEAPPVRGEALEPQRTSRALDSPRGNGGEPPGREIPAEAGMTILRHRHPREGGGLSLAGGWSTGERFFAPTWLNDRRIWALRVPRDRQERGPLREPQGERGRW